MNFDSLELKIKEKRAKIGVIGLGYVGLPLVMRFIQKGFKSIGFDIDEQKLIKLRASNTYIKHILSSDIKKAFDLGFEVTSNFDKIDLVDVIIICVPTPLGMHNEPDLSYILSTLNNIKERLRKNQLIVLESTTFPGTTEEEILPILNDLGFKIGIDLYLGYSPEREDPGNKEFSTKNIPKVVSGITKDCLSIVKSLYNSIIDETVPVSSTKVAEMTKILENIHRAVNIGLVNELKVIADKMNIDIYEVIKAASTKPFGFTPYYPGPGLGGHCIPIDPFYLSWKAKEYNINTRFIELAGEINTSMPNYVLNKIIEALNSLGKSIKFSKIIILGLSYKKNIDDLRESPSLRIIELLLKYGSEVLFSDPYFDEIPITRKFNYKVKFTDLNKKALNSADIIVLATDHDSFDYELIEKESNLIVDSRGRFKNSKKVIRA